MVKVFMTDLRLVNSVENIQEQINKFTPKNMIPRNSSTADCAGLLVITIVYEYDYDSGEGD